MIIGVMFVCTHCKDLRYCIQCYHDKGQEHQFDHAFIKLRSLFGIQNEIAWETENPNVRAPHSSDSLVGDLEKVAKSSSLTDDMEMINSKPTLQRTFSERLKNTGSSTLKKSVSGTLTARVSFFEGVPDQVVSLRTGSTNIEKYQEYPESPMGKASSSEDTKINAKFDNTGYVVSTSSSEVQQNNSARYSEGLDTPSTYLDSAETRYEESDLFTDDKPSLTASASNQYIDSVYSTDDLEYNSESESDDEDGKKEQETQVKKQTLIKSNSILRTDSYLNYYKSTYGTGDEELEDDEKENIQSNGYTESFGSYLESPGAYRETDLDDSSSEEEPEGLEKTSKPAEEPKKEVANPITTASIGAKGELEIMTTTRTLHPLMEKILAFPVRNWQDHLLDSYGKTEETKSETELLAQMQYYHGIVREFVSYAEMIARVIIDEAYLPIEQKSIKPVDVGGVAGGQKYLFKGIFFKFAIDSMGIYGGDSNAAKAANREILGIKAYFWARVPDLRVPITILVDYRGFRIIATPCLPIGKGTLKYGSDDGGVTVLKEDKILNEKMKLAAKSANLKGHKVGIKIPRKIYGPGDIEGHKGLDSRYYVIDTARVMPPFPPEKTFHVFRMPRDAEYADGQWTKMAPLQLIEVRVKGWRTEVRTQFEEMKINSDIELKESLFPRGSIFYIDKEHLKNPTLNRRATSMAQVPIFGDAIIVATSSLKGRQLYNLLRYEMLQQWKVPLSSDAFTMFQIEDEDKRQDEANLQEVEDHLKQKLIPYFAELLTNEEIKVYDGPTLTLELHGIGINIRFLGLLRPYLKNSPKYSSLVFAEMISRVAKVFLRTTLRRLKAVSVSGLAVNTLISYLNLVFGNSTASMYFWKHLIKPLVITKYGDVLTPEEIDPHYDLRDSVASRHELFTTLSNQIGVVLKDDVLEKFKANPKLFEKVNPFKPEDFVELRSIARSCVDSCLAMMIKNLTEYIENQKNNISNGDRNPMMPDRKSVV